MKRENGGDLKGDFGDRFAGSAFQHMDGEIRIVGRYGQITQFADGTYDVWFIGADLEPLSGVRLNRIGENSSQEEAPFKRLNGEASIRGAGHDFVLRMACLAGIKHKRRLSAETRQRLKERLAAIRHPTRDAISP